MYRVCEHETGPQDNAERWPATCRARQLQFSKRAFLDWLYRFSFLFLVCRVSNLPCIHWNYLISAPLFSRYSIYHINTFSGSQEYRMLALLNESTFYHVLGFVPASSALTPVQGEMWKTSAFPLGWDRNGVWPSWRPWKMVQFVQGMRSSL